MAVGAVLTDLLALQWFGFIFWSAAVRTLATLLSRTHTDNPNLQWYELNKGKRLAGPFQIWENVLAFLMMVTGIFFFGAGAYTSVQSIINSCRLVPNKPRPASRLTHASQTPGEKSRRPLPASTAVSHSQDRDENDRWTEDWQYIGSNL